MLPFVAFMVRFQDETNARVLSSHVLRILIICRTSFVSGTLIWEASESQAALLGLHGGISMQIALHPIWEGLLNPPCSESLYWVKSCGLCKALKLAGLLDPYPLRRTWTNTDSTMEKLLFPRTTCFYPEHWDPLAVQKIAFLSGTTLPKGMENKAGIRHMCVAGWVGKHGPSRRGTVLVLWCLRQCGKFKAMQRSASFLPGF